MRLATSEPRDLLLGGSAGWEGSGIQRLEVADGELRLRPLPGSGRPLADPWGSFGGLSPPTGVAIDRGGAVYLLDPSAPALRRLDRCGQAFETVPCIGGTGREPRQFRGPGGIAISPRGDLLIADSGNRRVQVLALKGLALRAVWGPLRAIAGPAGMRVEPVAPEPPPRPVAEGEATGVETFPAGTWIPWDVAASRERAYVSDYGNGVIHVLDLAGRWRAAWSTEAGGRQLERPTHLWLDREERLHVAQDGKDYVVVLDAEGAFVAQARRPHELPGPFDPPAVTTDADGNLWVQAADGVLGFDRTGKPLALEPGAAPPAPPEGGAAWEAQGILQSARLDSEVSSCTWHRVALRARIQQGTSIRVQTFTSESDKTAEQVRDLPASRWASAPVNATVGEADWDALVLSPPGRYLWLRVTLAGDGAATPSLSAIRVHFPRRTSLDHLPAVYREDPAGADFTGRFLAIFDTVRRRTSNQIDRMAAYFDAGAAPASANGTGGPDFLSWLASWLDLSLERHWPLAKRRRLLREAHRLFALRGTPEGLREHVRLYTGVEPRVLEHFKLRRWLFVDRGRLGDTAVLYGDAIVRRLQLDQFSQIGEFQLVDSGDPLRDPVHHFAHRFTVFVPACGEVDEAQRRTIERIVEAAKPAHTEASVQLGGPGLRIGMDSFVGVDTVVGRYPEGVAAGRARLGRGTVLGPSADEENPPTIRIGVRSRVGSTTRID